MSAETMQTRADRLRAALGPNNEALETVLKAAGESDTRDLEHPWLEPETYQNLSEDPSRPLWTMTEENPVGTLEQQIWSYRGDNGVRAGLAKDLTAFLAAPVGRILASLEKETAEAGAGKILPEHQMLDTTTRDHLINLAFQMWSRDHWNSIEQMTMELMQAAHDGAGARARISGNNTLEESLARTLPETARELAGDRSVSAPGIWLDDQQRAVELFTAFTAVMEDVRTKHYRHMCSWKFAEYLLKTPLMEARERDREAEKKGKSRNRTFDLHNRGWEEAVRAAGEGLRDRDEDRYWTGMVAGSALARALERQG